MSSVEFNESFFYSRRLFECTSLKLSVCCIVSQWLHLPLEKALWSAMRRLFCLLVDGYGPTCLFIVGAPLKLTAGADRKT